MRRGGSIAPRLLLSVATWLCVLLGSDVLAAPAAPYKPEGEMRWALYVTISPAWFDPGAGGGGGRDAFLVLLCPA